MAKRGRPPSPRAAAARIVHVKLRLYPGEDDDLIAFFDQSLPRLRAAAVKLALRSGMTAPSEALKADDEAMEVLDSLVS